MFESVLDFFQRLVGFFSIGNVEVPVPYPEFVDVILLDGFKDFVSEPVNRIMYGDSGTPELRHTSAGTLF